MKIINFYKLFLFIIFFQLNVKSLAQEESCRIFDEKGRTRDRVCDFISLKLEITFDVTQSKVFGLAKYKFQIIRQKVDSIVLDAPGITINSLQVNGKDLEYNSTENSLIIYLDKPLTWDEEYSLEIDYECTPPKGIYFLGFKDPTNRARKQIWTQGQGIDNRYWIPSFDDVSDKLITETIITFDKDYEVVSNGKLVSKKELPNNRMRWHYKMDKPHVLYLVMIAIGKYDILEMKAENGVFLKQYVYKDKPNSAAPTYIYSKEMMRWMEEEFQVPYVWGDTYRNVPLTDFLYGAMENTSSTTFTDRYLVDERESLDINYIGTNAHELTHQWFGDLITEWNGTSHWLHESFATHYAKHFKRYVLGENHYQWDVYNEMQRAMAADNRNDLPIANADAGSSRHYPKGSVVLDMLRNIVGEAQFKRVIHYYLEKYSFKHVDTHLFELAFTEVLGLNLDWFFDQWIYKGGYPHYKVTYSILPVGTEIIIEQIQEQNNTIGLFSMPIDIEIKYSNGTKALLTVQVDSAVTNLLLPNPSKIPIDHVIFDKGNKVYKKVTFDKTISELISQAINADDMIDRYFALSALDNADLKEKRVGLAEAFEKEEFYANRALIVKQLINDDNSKSKRIIELALNDQNTNVRRMCVAFSRNIDPKMLSSYEMLLVDSSYKTIEKALTRLCYLYPENTSSYLKKTKSSASQNHELNITWLRLNAALDSSSIEKLIDYSSASFDIFTRLKAIDALTILNVDTKDFLSNLIDASVYFNKRLANQARGTLLELLGEEQQKNKIVSILEEKEFSKIEKERLEAWTIHIE